MQIHRVVLMLLSLTASAARRSQKKRADDRNSLTVQTGGKACHISENDHSLKYGIQGSFRVDSCIMCKFNTFLTKTFYVDFISDAQPSENDEYCMCYTSPRFWEDKGLNKKFWFQFDKSHRECSTTSCRDVFSTWANMFNRKKWTAKYNKGEGDQMPLNLFIESQEGYDLRCDDSEVEAEGLHFPSPAKKIHDLRLQIEQCTDPEEKERLQKMLDELLAEGDVEVFAYATDEDWNPTEHKADASADGEHHTFFLKPCKSQKGKEVTELKDILELCGPPEMGVSMKGGQVRYHYAVQDPWGPEKECHPPEEILGKYFAEEECQLVQILGSDEGVGGEILSFRLRPCKSPGGKELTELSEIFDEKNCGPPSSKKDADGFATLLPVKMDVSKKYDETATFTDAMQYPCTDEENFDKGPPEP